MKVIGIKFKRAGKIYYFDPKGEQFSVGEGAIVETVRGKEYGIVALANFDINEAEMKTEIVPVIRKATKHDLEIYEANKAKRDESLKIAKEKVAKNNLQMKMIDCEYTFDCNKIIFYFTSDNRVDFRELVKDLASVFRMRIELRQVGIRDETKTLGGLAICGKPCCCNTHMPEFVKSSIKMAKTQNLSLNPQNISGLCGRLLCCLQFENDHYSQTAKIMPKVGSRVDTPDGNGEVCSCNMLKLLVKVKLQMPDGNYDFKEYPLDQIKSKHTMQQDFDKEEKLDKSLKNLED